MKIFRLLKSSLAQRESLRAVLNAWLVVLACALHFLSLENTGRGPRLTHPHPNEPHDCP